MNSHMPQYLKPDQVRIIESWDEFQQLVASNEYRRWAFRGQERSEWPLNSALSRYLVDYRVDRKSWAHQEDRIIRIFRRKAQLFLDHVPSEDDMFQWLALMQHHGAPTRLVDFTWSPFVAAFFALERARDDCSVWAVNVSAVQKLKYEFSSKHLTIEAPHPKDLKTYKEFFLFNDVPFVAPGEPWNMNQRQIAQSGTFLVPGILDKPIDEILSAYPHPEQLIVQVVLRSSKMRDRAMESLYYMNITNATLFPGLDGMARSLAYELEFHWAFNPKTMEQYLGPGYFPSDND